MSNSNANVNIGDWYSKSCHYSFLAGACFYRVVGRRGKSSLVVQEYGSIDESPYYSTRHLRVDRDNPIGEPVVVRLGKYGNFKRGNYENITRDGPEPRSYSGSAYD